nr:hypothetical protein [Burkholderia mallei]
MLVFDDADLDAAVAGIRYAGFYNRRAGLHGGDAHLRAARHLRHARAAARRCGEHRCASARPIARMPRWGRS